jgi:GTPase SAR1 family protein
MPLPSHALLIPHSQNTFKTLKNWVEELKAQGPQEIAIAVAGNKADLEDQRVRTDNLPIVSLNSSL